MNIENGKYIYGYDKKWSMWRRVHAQGGGRPKSRNHVRTTIGCFLFIGKKIYKNFGSIIAYLNYETCDYI